jgi:hypothetical protein
VGGDTDPVGPTTGFAGNAHDLAVAPDAIYVAYTLTDAEPGGVAVFALDERECRDLLWSSSATCDDCEDPNCVVLATIHGYRPGFAMLDIADPPTAPEDDLAAHIARIDDRAGRRLLPSTSVLTDVVTCLLDEVATQGPPGPKGDKGDPGQPGAQGEQGEPGPGLEKSLVRITAVSWEHDGSVAITDLENIIRASGDRSVGVMIAFTGSVSLDGIDAIHVFQVEAPDPGGENVRLGFACRCPVLGEVIPVDPVISGNLITEGTEVLGATAADAIAFVFEPRFVKNTLLNLDPDSDLWVRLRGDFVLDTDDPPRAIDAEFVRHEFDTGDRPAGSEFGVQGGIFESWFRPVEGRARTRSRTRSRTSSRRG